MSSRRLASSRTAALVPLGDAGQRVFEVIRRAAGAVGPAHAALFAEPFVSPQGDVIDWYADGDGPPIRLADAPEPRRAEGQARLDGLVADILAHADALAREADPERRRLGEALRNAVEAPGEASVFLLGAQPVLIEWAHRANAAQPLRGVLTGRVAAARQATPPPAEPAPPAPPPPEPPPPEPLRPWTFGWLWWLLWLTAGGLAASVAWLLLPACAVTGVAFLDWCPRPAPPTPAEVTRLPGLEAEAHQLERALLDADAVCRRPLEACLQPPPETALLLDASSSMAFGVATPAAVERELWEIVRRRNADGSFASEADARRYSDLVRGAQAPEMGEKRIDALRRALGGAMGMVDPLRVRIAPFAACGRLRTGPVIEDAAAARAAVDAMALESFTALAYAIGQATAALDGGLTAEDPVSIVLISDGFDTCGGDPCAAARAAKQARPGLSIDVVDLVGLPELRCVAAETGGRYVDASGGLEPAVLAQLLREAGARARPPVCAPLPPEAFALPPVERAEAAPAAPTAPAPPSPPPQPPPPPPRAERREPPRDDAADRVEEAGGATEGAFRVTLVWDTPSDLDLAVDCPGGGSISWRRKAACGGVLDVDRNDVAPSPRPVENIVFATAPTPGAYRVRVTNFRERGDSVNPFRLRVERDGRVETREGRVGARGETASFDFTYQ